jgi:hypothetical protein
MENIGSLAVVTKTCFPNRWLAMDFLVCSLLRERVFGEPLASNGFPLWLHYSSFQASCHNIMQYESISMACSMNLFRQ